MPRSRGRLSTSLATVILLGGAAGLSWMAAEAAVFYIERESRIEARRALDDSGYHWVEVQTDGLQVLLSGTASTEVERFRAMSQVSAVIDPSRIADQMTVAAAEALVPPDFEIELLRNDDGVSLIGLVPASTDRQALVRQLRQDTGSGRVTDMLEAADHPVPDHWDDSIRFGLRATQLAKSAKISIEPAAVHVAALADSAADKRRLEDTLRRMRPLNVTLTTDISAPRPVIAPFTLRFLIDDQGARFDACSADSDATRTRILDAGTAAGLPEGADCTLGLGAPGAEWGDGAVLAISAVAALGQGVVTLSDTDIALVAPVTVPQDRFDEVAGSLQQALPAIFTLQTELERVAETEAPGPVEFSATSTSHGALTMRGRITDERMRGAVDSIAGARFSNVESSLHSDGEVPNGWTVRVIAALEALSTLQEGTVAVTPDLLRLSGNSGDPRAVDRAATILSQRLGAGSRYELAIRYDRRLDVELALPDGEECVSRLNLILSESEIGFEPGRSILAGDPADTLARLAAVMTDCTEFHIEAGGHTDAQGSADLNAELSQARAETVVEAMAGAGMDTRHIDARGYGETQPIASNDTEEGREANRRIEFRLLSPLPIIDGPSPAPELRQGVTVAAEDLIDETESFGPVMPRPDIPEREAIGAEHSHGPTGAAEHDFDADHQDVDHDTHGDDMTAGDAPEDENTGEGQ